METKAEGLSYKRVVVVAAALLAVGVVFELALQRSPTGAMSLTAAGLVAIINFRWLGVVLQRVVRPGEPRFDSWSVLRILGRVALFGAVLAALVWLPRVDPVAVALGFSALVVALVVEGARSALENGG